MPSLNAKALAEMLLLPAYSQSRLLHAQKYPKQEPQKFRTPYYLPAMAAIRNFYKNGHNSKILENAIIDIKQIQNEARRAHNLRVLDKFSESGQYKRALQLVPNPKSSVVIDTVEIRLSADMRALEGEKPRVMFYNCSRDILDSAIARKTLEIAYWIVQEDGAAIGPRCFEYIDLQADKVHRLTHPNAATIKLVKRNIPIIKALWDAA